MRKYVFFFFLKAGSISLYWKLDEGLYESGPVGVPLGEHLCQLAVGRDGDVVTTEPFVVNEDSDVIFIILKEGMRNLVCQSNRLAVF